MENDKKTLKAFKVLSSDEENKLTYDEIKKYYAALRDYCVNRSLEVTTKGALTVAPKLKGITNKIAKRVTKILSGGHCIKTILGVDNIPDEPAIFACTHQGILDGFVWIPDCPRHLLIVHGKETNKLLILAQVNTGLILVTKEKGKTIERQKAKLDMMSTLLKGHSFIIFPETSWNMSPNKLHLPINYGFIDVAKKTGAPIIPMMINYEYDTSSAKERITDIDIRYGKPIYVSADDNLEDKVNEYSEAISTMRYESIESSGMKCRNDITNFDYINYLKGNLANLKLGKIDMNREREGIYGSSDEKYVFSHLNMVDFDDAGNLLETEEAERLKKINMRKRI